MGCSTSEMDLEQYVLYGWRGRMKQAGMSNFERAKLSMVRLGGKVPLVLSVNVRSLYLSLKLGHSKYDRSLH